MGEQAKVIERPRFNPNDKARDIARAIFDTSLNDFVELRISPSQIAAATGVGVDKAQVIAACLRNLLRENHVEPRPAMTATK